MKIQYEPRGRMKLRVWGIKLRGGDMIMDINHSFKICMAMMINNLTNTRRLTSAQ